MKRSPKKNFEKGSGASDTKAHIQIRGCRKAIEKMRKVVEELEEEGIKIRVTVSHSGIELKKNRSGSKR